MRTRFAYVVFGLLSTAVGMAVGYLVASFINPAAAPITAVGEVIIQHTPVAQEQWAIRHFGSNDKTFLKYSVIAAVLVVVAIIMFLIAHLRRRALFGSAVLVVIVAIAGAAALNRPTATFSDVVPALATAVAGVAAFLLLDRSLSATTLLPGRPSRRADKVTGTPGVSSDEAAAAGTGSTSGRHTDTEVLDHDVERPGPSRRLVLVTAGALAVLAAAASEVGRAVTAVKAKAENIALPKPSSTAPAIPTGLDDMVPGITPLQTSNNAFYRVDTRAGDTPVLDSGSWSLTVDGDVKNQLNLSFDDLLNMKLIERDITLTCVSNSVGGPYVGGARWLGVPLKTILDMAGVGSSADQILATDFDGMTISTPLDLATDGRDAMLAIGMNGVALPREHGFPVRVVIPGLYGFISATKWVTKLTLTTYAAQESYWTQRGWDTDSPIKPSTRIDTPGSLAQVKQGEVIVGGVAWAQNNDGIKKVQVQIDGGPWQDATNGPDVGSVYWRQWYYKAKITSSGTHTIAARCIDGQGKTQTAVRANPYPGGSSGIQSIVVTAT